MVKDTGLETTWHQDGDGIQHTLLPRREPVCALLDNLKDSMMKESQQGHPSHPWRIALVHTVDAKPSDAPSIT